MRLQLEKENVLRISGKSLSIQPTNEGFVVTESAAVVQPGLFEAPKSSGRGRPSKSKVQTGVETSTGAVPGPRDGESGTAASF